MKKAKVEIAPITADDARFAYRITHQFLSVTCRAAKALRFLQTTDRAWLMHREFA